MAITVHHSNIERCMINLENCPLQNLLLRCEQISRILWIIHHFHLNHVLIYLKWYIIRCPIYHFAVFYLLFYHLVWVDDVWCQTGDAHGPSNSASATRFQTSSNKVPCWRRYKIYRYIDTTYIIFTIIRICPGLMNSYNKKEKLWNIWERNSI